MFYLENHWKFINQKWSVKLTVADVILRWIFTNEFSCLVKLNDEIISNFYWRYYQIQFLFCRLQNPPINQIDEVTNYHHLLREISVSSSVWILRCWGTCMRSIESKLIVGLVSKSCLLLKNNWKYHRSLETLAWKTFVSRKDLKWTGKPILIIMGVLCYKPWLQ